MSNITKKRAYKAIDFVQSHQKGTFLVSGALIVGGTIVGTAGYIAHRKQRRFDKRLGLALQEYLDAARNGTLNIDLLSNLINLIDELEKNNFQKSISLNISSDQFGDLMNCIFDFTKRLAEANNFDANFINRPKYCKEKTTSDLKYYLNMQKQIFEQAA